MTITVTTPVLGMTVAAKYNNNKNSCLFVNLAFAFAGGDKPTQLNARMIEITEIYVYIYVFLCMYVCMCMS